MNAWKQSFSKVKNPFSYCRFNSAIGIGECYFKRCFDCAQHDRASQWYFAKAKWYSCKARVKLLSQWNSPQASLGMPLIIKSKAFALVIYSLATDDMQPCGWWYTLAVQVMIYTPSRDWLTQGLEGQKKRHRKQAKMQDKKQAINEIIIARRALLFLHCEK